MERVCGKHFVSGWPSDDTNDVDYRPILLMKGHSVDVKLDNTESARKQRASKRSERSHLKEVAEVYVMLLTLLNCVHNWPNLFICNVLVIIGTKKDLLNLPLYLI